MMRSFRDEAGREWTVFAVTRGEMFGGEVQFLPTAFADGWLVFQSPEERYRLAPIPERWTSVSATELSELLSSVKHPAGH